MCIRDSHPCLSHVCRCQQTDSRSLEKKSTSWLGVWPAPKVSSLAKERLKRLLPIAVLLVFLTLETHAAPKSDLWDHWTAHQPESTLSPDYQIWSDFLRRYLDNSNSDGIHRVDYAGLTAEDLEDLKQYLLRLQKIPVSRLSRIQQLSYWINLYNPFTFHLILEHYPLDSIVDICSGFFFRPLGWKTASNWRA